MRIKICGLFRDEDIDTVNRFLPDFAGFVFAESRRKVTPEKAKRLIAKMSGKITPVGVFVDETADNILKITEQTGIKIIQLHGNENEDFIKTLKNKTDLPIIKAIKPGGKIPENADFLLFDSEIPGSGKTFDRSLLPKTKKPWFLAGGINIGNIKEAISLAPYGIDISSGVETNGVKDPAKIKEITEAVK
ncbi:MAG: phosphoribosylanthranilate isomerase [Ruminococcus sp.]|jgi:phosphoribosylanthranilate isomerase|nr:phosphoribosylanthranilate isomerase [Ruminococcus sp.]